MPEARDDRKNAPDPEAVSALSEPAYLHDAELVRSCLAGDNEAWTTLLRRYHRLIYSIPRRYGLDPDDAADVYQAVALALWKGLGKLRSEKALTNWILTTTSRQSDRLSRRRKRQKPADVDEEAIANLPAPVVDPLGGVQDLEDRHRIQQAMVRLPTRCAELLTRLYLLDNSVDYDTVASDLGIPRGSIGPSRSRCLEKMKKLLARE